MMTVRTARPNLNNNSYGDMLACGCRSRLLTWTSSQLQKLHTITPWTRRYCSVRSHLANDDNVGLPANHRRGSMPAASCGAAASALPSNLLLVHRPFHWCAARVSIACDSAHFIRVTCCYMQAHQHPALTSQRQEEYAQQCIGRCSFVAYIALHIAADATSSIVRCRVSLLKQRSSKSASATKNATKPSDRVYPGRNLAER